jgi:hypothetical protein
VCEAGDGERAGGVDVAFCAVLEVAEVGYAAEIFVLWERGVSCLGVECKVGAREMGGELLGL